MSQTHAEAPPGRYGYAVMGVQWTLDVTVPIVGFSLGVLLPQMTQELGLTPIQSGILGSSFFLGSLSVALFSSVVLSRYSPKLVNTVAMLLGALLVAAQAVAPNFLVLVLARFLFIISVTSRVQSEVLLIQQWFSRRQVALINSITAASFSAGQTLAVLITPLALVLVGTWRGFYMALSVLLVAIAVVWMVVGRERPRPRQAPGLGAPRNPLLVLRRHKLLWVLGLAPAGGALSFSAFMTFWPSYGMEAHGYSLATVGGLMALYPFAGIASTLVAGPLSDLMRRRKPLIWVPGLVLPPAYLALLSVGSVPWLTVLMLVTGVCAWVWVSIIRTVPFDMGLEPREIAVATGLTMTLLPLGGASGPLIAGAVLEVTGSLYLALLAVSFFPLTLLLGLFLPETSPFRRASPTPTGTAAP